MKIITTASHSHFALTVAIQKSTHRGSRGSVKVQLAEWVAVVAGGRWHALPTAVLIAAVTHAALARHSTPHAAPARPAAPHALSHLAVYKEFGYGRALGVLPSDV